MEKNPSLSSFLERAFWSLERGFRVHPIEPKGKRPLVEAWQEKATRDKAQVEAWGKLWPDANCALSASKDDGGTFTLDFDSMSYFMEFFDEMPKTLVVQTGSGKGLQVHFRHSKRSKAELSNRSLRNADPKRWGPSSNVLEVKAENAYGIGPGSVHPSGGVYSVRRDLPLSEATDQLLDKIAAVFGEARRSSSVSGSALLRKAREDWEQVLAEAGLKYERRDKGKEVFLEHHVTMVGCLVKGSLHVGDSGANEKNNDCCAFVYGKENRELWYKCFAGGCEGTPGKLPTALKALGLTLDDVMEPRPGMFDSLADFEAAGELEWLIDGVCHVGEATGWAGLQKNGKSWILLSIIKALLTGDDWFGHKVKKAKRVVYFVPEVGRVGVFYRLKKMGLDKFLDKALFVRTSALGVPDLEDREVLAACKGADVFLDTLIRFLDGSENDSIVIAEFAKKMFKLLSVARSVHAAAHTQKAYAKAEDMGPDMFRGSGDVTAALSNGYGVMQIDEPSNTIYVKALFGRDLPELAKPFVLRGRPDIDESGDFTIVDDDAGSIADSKQSIGGVSDEQKKALKECFDAGMTPRQAVKELERRGLDKGLKSKNTVEKRWKEMGLEKKTDPQQKMDY